MNVNEAVEVVEADKDHRIIRRVPVLPVVDHTPDYVGCIIDVETTGLGEPGVLPGIIEFGAVLFGYDKDGRFTGVLETYSSLNDPGIPIEEEAASIHGITDGMVSGHSLDTGLLYNMISKANVVIAHNASFDRPIVEKESWMPSKPWACSLRDIDWHSHGVISGRLEFIVYRHNVFFDGHRALDDCMALAYILSEENDGEYLPEMMKSARSKSTVLFIHDAFNEKDALKEDGFSWGPADFVVPKTWRKEFSSSEEADAARDWVLSLNSGLSCTFGTITARSRYSDTPYVLAG